MNTINVTLGTAPNGVRVWGVSGKKNDGLHIGRSVEKPYLDQKLPPTASDEEYHYEVAKYASKMFFEMLKDYDVPFNKDDYEFICCGQRYTIK